MRETSSKEKFTRGKRNIAMNRLYASLTVAIVVVLGLIFIGMKIEQARFKEPLPANQACIAAIDGIAKALQGEAGDVQGLIKTCRDNQTKYEVVVAK